MLTKIVNGVRTECSAQEEQELTVQWAQESEKPVPAPQLGLQDVIDALNAIPEAKAILDAKVSVKGATVAS